MSGGERHIGVAARRARPALRHRLAGAARAAGPEEVTDSLAGDPERH